MFIANHIYSIYKYDNYGNFTFNTYLWWVYLNLVFGLPLGIIINLINQYYLLKKHLKIAAGINDAIHTSPNEETQNRHSAVDTLEFVVDKYKKLQIKVDSLLYVEAMGNYVNIVYECNGIKKVTIRETINNIERRVRLSQNIYRPHRSYLINLLCIDNVTGDAQGLKIHFKDMDTAIPVSRNKIKEFRLLTSSKM
jgi:DNA-binding LytR/AlgR family response regulator